MTLSIDELYARWQANPDAAQTIALCEALRGSPRIDLVEIVGSHASRQPHVPTLLAAARMHVDAGRLDDAQAVLVAAGRLAPRDGDVYRWLGEVLLRRGDAARAEKVLERALHFGGRETAAAHALLERARGGGAPAAAGYAAGDAHERAHASAHATARDDDETETRERDGIRDAMEAALAPLSAPLAAARAPQTAAVAASPPERAPARAEGFASAGTAPFGSAPAPAPAPRDVGLAPLRATDFAAAGPGRQEDGASAPHRASSTATVPEPRDVLDALQTAGIFEPEGEVRPQTFAWAAPERGKRRIAATLALVGVAVVFVAGGFGTFHYVKVRRAKQHVEAEAILADVDRDLRTSQMKALAPSEAAIARAFDLESRSPHAALTWLHERAMKGLIEGGESIAFEEATARAKDVGVPDGPIAFAHVASFLFQGDTAGAAAQIAKWDALAEGDAWFQLLAGATFERAGDGRALERYDAAAKLDPELVIARILLTRAMAIDGDPAHAATLARELEANHGAPLEGTALVALAWARDARRETGAPPELGAIADKADALPLPLRSIAHASRAILALERHAPAEAKPALEQALAVAQTPGVAAWLGSIALATGDEALARKAALVAISFSALYPPARVLAARVALLGARLDEAARAVEDLPAASTDVAVVTAAVAYEKLDAERMSRAFDAAPADAKRLPFVVPLAKGQALLAGDAKALGPAEKVVDMADDDAPWADLVAMDYALDVGDLELASKIRAEWPGDARPLRAVRLARLARYEGKLEDAERYSRAAIEGGTVTGRAFAERAFVLVAAGKPAEALALFKAHPNVGGPLAKWLRAYATAASGKHEEAKAIVSQEDPPPALAPLPARVVAAATLAAVKDTRRGADYARAIFEAGFENPDVTAAAEKLGGRGGGGAGGGGKARRPRRGAR